MEMAEMEQVWQKSLLKGAQHERGTWASLHTMNPPGNPLRNVARAGAGTCCCPSFQGICKSAGAVEDEQHALLHCLGFADLRSALSHRVLSRNNHG